MTVFNIKEYLFSLIHKQVSKITKATRENDLNSLQNELIFDCKLLTMTSGPLQDRFFKPLGHSFMT